MKGRTCHKTGKCTSHHLPRLPAEVRPQLPRKLRRRRNPTTETTKKTGVNSHNLRVLRAVTIPIRIRNVHSSILYNRTSKASCRRASPSWGDFKGDARARSLSFFCGLWLWSGRLPVFLLFALIELRDVFGVAASCWRGECSEVVRVPRQGGRERTTAFRDTVGV